MTKDQKNALQIIAIILLAIAICFSDSIWAI